MSNTQHFEQNKNMVLHEGNVYLIADHFIDSTDEETDNDAQLVNDIENEPPYIDIRGYLYPILFTTDPTLTGVNLLDRKHFVREEDVEEIAKQAVIKRYVGVAFADRGEMSEYHIGYRDGYNAKKGEYTESQMRDAIRFGIAFAHNRDLKNLQEDEQEFLNSLRPLSLPQSPTIENGNITKTDCKMEQFRTGNVVMMPGDYMCIVSRVNKDTIEWVSFCSSNSSGISSIEDTHTDEICYDCNVNGKDDDCIICKGNIQYVEKRLGFKNSKFLSETVESYIKSRLLKNFEFN